MNSATQSQKAQQFRALHEGPGMLVLPNAWDVIGARLIEEAGFPAIATSSAGVAWALGWPDGERISRGEMLAVVRRIRSEEHTSELQSPCNLVCRLLLEKKKKKKPTSCHIRQP